MRALRPGAALVALAILAVPVRAQSAAEWVEQGHAAARADRHEAAIAAFERALAQEPALRAELLAPLGRQYLWADRPERAAALLGEAAAAGAACDVRADHGLALAWSDRTSAAGDVLASVISACPAERVTAQLRLALVRRWQDRPSAAAALYRQILQAAGDAGVAREARLGLAHTALQGGNTRAALRAFRELRAGEGPELPAIEGEALALARLGLLDRAEALLAEVEPADRTRDLRTLASAIAAHDRPRARAEALAFRDADGTSHEQLRLAAATGWSRRGRATVAVSRWTLRQPDPALEPVAAVQVAAGAEHRWNAGVAARGELAWNTVLDRQWQPLTGEAHVVLTPGDRLRVDLSAARLLVADSRAALAAHLAGTFASLGADVRVRQRLTFTGAADVIRWSTGNHRTRFRASARWHAEGVPRITLELPVLVQLYDRPMPFAFFSPRRYVEAGPAVTLYRRFGRSWHASLYGRVGAQQESGRGREPFATTRGMAWREVAAGWELRGAVAWSNSNVASPTSFERTTVELGLGRVF